MTQAGPMKFSHGTFAKALGKEVFSFHQCRLVTGGLELLGTIFATIREGPD